MIAKPLRIQRKRSKGWKNTTNAIYVGRPTRWGNPFNWQDYPSIEGSAKAHVVELFKQWMNNDPALKIMARAELRGKNLSCWCKEDEPCHADVLLDIANG